MLIGVKFCGGCNPQIDRGILTQRIEKELPAGWELTSNSAIAPWEKAILVCGCPVACGDHPGLKNLARKWILVSGAMVDLEWVPEEQIPSVVVKKILDLKE